MLEQEMADLCEGFRDGAGGLGGNGGQGWSLIVPVWNARGSRVLGCLRVESTGGADGADTATEFEEYPFAR